MNKLFIFLLLCLFSSVLLAQEQFDLCLDFEELPKDAVFGRPTGFSPGDEVINQGDFQVSLEVFTDANREASFSAITVLDDPFSVNNASYGRGLFVSGINVKLNFNSTEEEITRIVLQYADGGGVENIAVNGGEVQIIESFDDLDETLAPNVDIFLERIGDTSNVDAGRLILEGNIQSLLIGGEELFIDDICVDKRLPNACEIRDLTLNAVECLENQTYLAEINFKADNAESEYYDIFLDGEFVDTRLISELSDTLVFPIYDHNSIPKLTVCIDGNTDCCATIEFDQPNCDFVGDCVIEFVDLQPTECNEEGEYLVNVFVGAQEGSADGYFIEDISGERWGPFIYADSTVVIGPYSDLLAVVQEFTIVDADNEDCQFKKELLNPCSEECIIEALTLEAQECDDNGQFLVNIYVQANNGSEEGFYIVDVFQERFGPFSYSTEPIIALGPYSDLDDVLLVFTAVDAANENCKKQEELFDVCDRCRIGEVLYEAHPCDDNGQFLLDIEVTGGGSENGYFIVFQGQEFGPFGYLDSIVTIGPFSAGFDVPPELSIYDAEDPNCAWYDYIETPCGAECELEIALEISDCDENNQFFVEAIVSGGTGKYFVEAGGRTWGPFVYEDSTAIVGPFPATQEAFSVVIHDANIPYCSDTLTIRTPCTPSDCGLADIRVETKPCKDNGLADLLIDFDNLTDVQDTFAIKYEGQVIGYYNRQNDLPLQIRNFPFGEETTLQICTYDERGECATDTRLVLPNCGNGSCFLTDAEVTTEGCDANGQFYFKIEVPSNFDHAADGFVVDVLGQQFGPFAYQDSAVYVGPFDGNIDLPYEVYIFDLFRDDCFYIEEFASPCEGSCTISDVQILPKECDENGQFYVELFVRANNLNSGGYVVDVFGEQFGPFSYYDSTAIIGPFDGNIDLLYEIIISDSENTNCFHADTFTSPCTSQACSLEITLGETDCDDARQFFVEFGVWNTNPQREAYRLRVNGEDFGTFSYYDSLAFVGPFDGNSNAPFEFIIQDLLDEDCILKGEFFSPCAETCRLTDLSAETSECKDNGRFDIIIDFDAQNVTDTLFDIYYNDTLAGTYSVLDLPLKLEDFGFAQSFEVRQHIKVCLQNNPDCCAEIEFTPPCAISDCQITEVSAVPLTCENNQFNVELTVKSEQPNYTGYFLQVDEGQLFGPFSYQQESIIIGPFEGDASTVYKVTVIDGEDRSCKNGTRFQAVNCSSQCSISDLRIDVGEICSEDGRFPLTIDFDIENPVGMGYSILADDRLLGTYPYGTIPAYFPSFDARGKSEITISVIAGEDRSCAMRKIFEVPECGLNNEAVWPGDTDNNGIAHYTDLLNIGLAYGETGPTRPEKDIEWYAHEATRWGRVFADGTDYKHADANGDGRIDELDVEAIQLNYGNLSSDVDTAPEIDEGSVVATEGDPSIYVDLPENGDFPSGSAFSVPVILGSADRSVESVYGIAFTIKYNPEVLDPNEVRLTIPDSWLGDAEEDLLVIQREYPERGLVEVAISRKDGESVTGYGVVALMSGIIIDVIGFKAIEVGVTKVKAVRIDSEQIPINPENRIANVTATSTKKWSESGLKIFPNPVSDFLQLKNTSSKTIERVEVISLQGKLMKQFIRPENQILVSDLPNGLYLLKIQLGDDIYHQQIIKQ
ncbi:MAG: T9SS type A sorting domain-containing protein [Bacteroidota bacterium]